MNPEWLTAGAVDLRDNIFVNTQTVGTVYSILSNAFNTVFSNIDYNDYFCAGPNLGYIGGTNRVTLADIQAGFGGNLNSQSLNPDFIGTDLHPTAAGLIKTGTYLVSVPADFTGAGRTNPPDMGAYQFSADPAVVTIAASGITTTSATLNGTINASNATVASGFDYGLTIAYGSSLAGSPVTVTGNSVTPVTGAIAGLTPGSMYHFRATGTSGGVTIYGNDLTFTAPMLPDVITTAATGVTGTTATVNGTVNANNFSTDVTFDYGLTVAYGTTVPGVPTP